jgi:hypothetical protein
MVIITAATSPKIFPISTGWPALVGGSVSRKSSIVTSLPRRPLSEEAEDESERLEDQAADDDEEEHVCFEKVG